MLSWFRPLHPLVRILPSPRRRPFQPRLEELERRDAPAVIGINAATGLHPTSNLLLGTNLDIFDPQMSSTPSSPDGNTAANGPTAGLLNADGVQLIRMTTGSEADLYHFDDQTNQTARGTRNAGTSANLIAAAGAQGLVTLNYGTGSVREALAYLAYIDGDVNNNYVIGVDPVTGIDWKTVSYWASLRAAAPQGNGMDYLRADHPAPYGFKYFEVGNEVYFGFWQGMNQGPNPRPSNLPDVAHYVPFIKQFAALAPNVVPAGSISIGVDVYDPNPSDPSPNLANWDTTLFAALAAPAAFVPGFISDHSYDYTFDQIAVVGTDPAVFANPDGSILQVTSAPGSQNPSGNPLNWSDRAQAFETLLTAPGAFGAAGAQVQLFATEFNSELQNIMTGDLSKQTTSLVNGLYLADSLGSLADSPYTGANFFVLREGYNVPATDNPNLFAGDWRTGGDFGMLGDPFNTTAPATGPDVPYPTYFAEQLVSKWLQNGAVVLSVTYDPTVTTYALQEPNGDVSLLIINKSATTDIPTTFNLNGFTASGTANLWQYGKTQDDEQRRSSDGVTNPDTGMPLSLLNHPNFAITPGSSFTYVVPSYSMTVLELTRGTTTTTTLTGTPNPVPGGQPVTLTAVIGGTAPGLTPTGTVTFSENGVVLGSAPILNGQAVLSHTFTAGNHTIVALYSGDTHFLASQSAVLTEVVTGGAATSNVGVLRATGTEGGVTATVTVFLSSGASFPVQPFGGFTGTVHVAVGDVSGDSINDLVIAAGPGGSPEVKVYDGAALLQGRLQLDADFYALPQTFLGGIEVAVGHVTNAAPGQAADIVIGAGAGGLPQVNTYAGGLANLSRLSQMPVAVATDAFYAFVPFFPGTIVPNLFGVRVAVGDVDRAPDASGQFHDDVIVTPGPGLGPEVRAFSGQDITAAVQTPRILRDFFAYRNWAAVGYTSGVQIAAGDVNGDGFADIIIGAGTITGSSDVLLSGGGGNILQVLDAGDGSFPGPANNPEVVVFDGRSTTPLGKALTPLPNSPGVGFAVAVEDTNTDGIVDALLLGFGPVSQPLIVRFATQPAGGGFSITGSSLFTGVNLPGYNGGLRIAGNG